MNRPTLKSVSTVITKGTTPTSVGGKFTESGIIFIKSESITGSKHPAPEYYTYIDEATDQKLKRSRLREGDLLVSIAGAYLGKLAIVTKRDVPSNTNQAVGIVRLDPQKACVDYIYYFFSQPHLNAHINKLSSQSSQPNLNLELLGNLEFDPRSIAEQKRIASVLSSFDAKIELNNRINAELEGIAKLLYDYWFVQFDFPMTAAQAATLGKPQLAGKPYRASGGKMIYNETLKREIPYGWKNQAISCMIEIDKSGDWGEETATGNYKTEVYCIRGADFPSLNGEGSAIPPKRFILGKNEFKILKPNDLIIEISGGSPVQSTGRVSALSKPVFARFDKPLICSNFCKALSLSPDTSVFYFYRTWARFYDNGVFFNWEGKTSGIKNLLFDSFVKNNHIVKPDKEVVKVFDDILLSFEEFKQKNLVESQVLTQLRDWLLPMLMNGQVTVN